MEPHLSKTGEVLKNGRKNLIYLPFEDQGYPNIPMQLIEEFNPALYIQNSRLMGLVEHFHKTFGQRGERAFKRGTYPISDTRSDKALKIIEELKTAHYSDTTFEREIGEQNHEKLPMHSIRKTIDIGLTKITGKSCLMSPSHLTDFHMIESLRLQGVDLSEVGIIVVDQHIDGSLNLSPNGGFILDKSNFLIPILNSGIGAVSIMGIDEEDIPSIRKEKNPLFTNLPDERIPDSYIELREGLRNLQEFQERYKDRVHLASGILGDARRMNKPKKVLDSIAEQISFFKKKGIKNVLISFDLDSLNLMKEIITATPYSPFTTIALLGLQDLSQVLDAAGVDEKTFEDKIRRFMQINQEINTLKILKNKKGILSPKENDLFKRKQADFSSLAGEIYPVAYNLEECLHSFKCPATIQGMGNLFMQVLKDSHIISSDEGGLGLDQAEFIIKSIQSTVEAQGMENGVPVLNGRVMGSVSELDGPDVNGNSSRAAIRLINAIVS